MIAIVKYNVEIWSVQNTLNRLGYNCLITDDVMTCVMPIK